MDKLTEHAIRMLEISKNENYMYKTDVDMARAIYELILRVQVLEAKERKK